MRQSVAFDKAKAHNQHISVVSDDLGCPNWEKGSRYTVNAEFSATIVARHACCSSADAMSRPVRVDGLRRDVRLTFEER